MTVSLHERLAGAQQATAQGQYPEALERFLWFHRHSGEEPGWEGVRLSFALSSWAELAERYPPAGEAMRGVREAAEGVVLDGAHPDQERTLAFFDVAALNRQLGLDEWTVALYRRLSVQAPSLAHRCGSAAFGAVAASGDAALALHCLGGDPEQILRGRARTLSEALDDPEHPPVHVILRFYLRTLTQVMAVLRLNGRDADVRRIRELAVQIAPSALRDQIQAALNPPNHLS